MISPTNDNNKQIIFSLSPPQKHSDLDIVVDISRMTVFLSQTQTNSETGRGTEDVWWVADRVRGIENSLMLSL